MEWPYRSKGSVEPGSVAIFGSVSGSENQILWIFYSKDTFCGSLDTELVSWLWFAESLIHILCIGAFPAVGMNFLKRPVDMTLEFSHGGATLHPPLPTSPCARK